MKKILTVSVLAMMAVTAANAEIASKAYVDARETAANQYTNTKIGTLPGNAENVGAAIGNLGDSTTVAAAIAAAVQNGTNNAVIHTGAVGSATQPVFVAADGTATASTSTVGGETQPVYLNAGTITAGTALGTMAYEAAANYTKTADLGEAASKGVATTVAEDGTDLPTAGAVYTYVNTQSAASNFVEDSVNSASTAKAPSGHAVSEALALKANSADLGDLATKSEVAKSDLATALASEIEGKADKATTLAGYSIADAYTKTETDTALGLKEDKANKVTAVSSTSTDTEYPSAKAVYTAVEGAKSDTTALATRVTTAEGDIDTLEGKMTTAESNITTLQSDKQDKLTASNVVDGTGTGNVVSSVTASNGTVTVDKGINAVTVPAGAWGTNDENGVYALTASKTGNDIVYHWELITRASGN